MSTTIIRLAHNEDIPAVMNIIADTIADMKTYGNDQWDETYPTAEDFERDIHENALFVCEERGSIKGVICLNCTQPDEYGGIDWSYGGIPLVIHRMAVAVHARKEGIGSELLQFAFRTAKQNGIQCVRTDTYSLNEKMIRLFEKNGFVFRGTMTFRGKPNLFHAFDNMLT